MGFPGGSAGKESTYNAADLDSLPGLGLLEKGTATHSSILAWRIPWTIYSPRCHKESNTTERISLSFFHIYIKFGSRCIFFP